MRVIERRLVVELISKEALCLYMDHKGMSLQRLADAVTRDGVPTSKATIGHLTSGHIKSTSPARARAICRVLDVPLAVFFKTEVSTVTRDVPPVKKGRNAA